MLERLQQIAISLKPLSPAFLALAILSLAFGIYVLLSSSSQTDDMALIPAIMLFTWATMARSFTVLFFHVPARASKEMKFVMRLKVSLRRIPYYCFLVLFAAATLFLIITSWQLSSAWRMMY